MPSSLFPISVRIPRGLNKHLKQYAAKNNVTKSDVIVAALARYLGDESKVPMNQRMVELEQQMAEVQKQIEQLKASIN